MMNNKLLLAAGVATLSASIFSTGAFAASATGNASATVLEPLAITAGAGMDFGDVAGDADNATTVSLSSGGIATAGTGANASGSPAAGVFNVTGEDTLAYDITLPTSTLLTGGGGADMTVNGFTDSEGGSASLVAGSGTFNVGAVLNINAGQGAGNYTGTYSVIVEYQ